MARIAKDLRNDNRIKVYELLLTGEVLSRADISRRTGMSAPTVMRIMDELLELGIVAETDITEWAMGRRPTGILIREDYCVYGAILHEGDILQAGILNIRGDVVYACHVKAERDIACLLEKQAPQLISDMLAQMELPAGRLAGLGVGLPAILDPYANRVVEAPLIGIDGDMDISRHIEVLSGALGVPVRIENDVNALVIGEHAHRKLGDKYDTAYIAMGTGLGAGLMLRGELRRGGKNMAGEIGYLYTGIHDAARGSEGDLENKIGIRGLEWRFGVDFSKPLPESAAKKIIEFIAQVLTPCIVNMSIAIDLDLVVLGGRVVDILGDALIDSLIDCAARISRLPVAIERGVATNPGLIGLGTLMQEQFLKQLRQNGLQMLRAFAQ